jgi:hypothetical protein
MGKVKNWIMDVEEFCDNFFCDGESEYTVKEIVDLAESKFGFGGRVYAKEYIEKTLDEI